jgi:hypothetical protein
MMRRLLHRWLVEYNPLYLISATLVLGGMILTSRGLALEGSVYGELAVAAIAEAYAAALIGGAALLTRIGQRRPAVMLALLTVLYQGDLTLHTEACVNLGTAGLFGTAAWVGLFVVKLYGLAWALRLTPSRAAVATATLGAFGLATFPYVLQSLDARAAGALVAVWLFAMASLFAHAKIASAVPLESWGQTVLRRATRATWLLWAAMLALHLIFWSTLRPLALGTLATVAPLLLVRRLTRESHVWGVVLGLLVVVGLGHPPAFAVCALVSACALGLRALRSRDPGLGIAQASAGPYRGLVDGEEQVAVAQPDGEARLRLAFGALFALYLSIWTHGWTGGAWPAHVAVLDLTMLVLAVAIAVRTRSRFPLGPLGLGAAHLLVQLRLVPEPRSLLGWGVASLTLGFLSLLIALAASYRFRDVRARDNG